MLTASLQKNDRKARIYILTVSIIVFVAVTVLGKYNLAGKVSLPFDEHIFATANAFINTTVAILLIAGLLAVKRKHYQVHKNIMLFAMGLSILFLLSYICHHLFAGETRFGDVNHDGLVSDLEKAAVGSSRMIYLQIFLHPLGCVFQKISLYRFGIFIRHHLPYQVNMVFHYRKGKNFYPLIFY